MPLAALLLFALLGIAGCGDPPTPPAPPPPAEDREAKASALLTRSRAAPVDEKVVLLKKVAGVYGDTKVAPRAHFELVLYQLLLEPPAFDEAFASARAFAERHPTEPLVSEGFHRVYDAAKFRGKPDLVPVVAEAWLGWLPKSVLLPDLVGLHIAEGRWEDAKVAADAALADPALPRHRRAELLHRKGVLLARYLGDPATGCMALRESLAVCLDLEALQVPMRYDAEGVLVDLADVAGRVLSLFSAS
jgi:hypothetical protein